MEENKVNSEVKENNVANPTNEVKPQQRSFSKDGQKRDFKGKGKRRGDSRYRRDLPKEFEEKVVSLNRVTKVVKGGKRMKFAALVVVGNGKGKFGFATGKSGEVPDAIKKAVERAKKNLFFVKMSKGSTITHDVVGVFGATKVYLKPAPDGTGIIAGGSVRAILELAGVKNVYSKIYGSRTSINVIRATTAAITSLKSFKDVEALRKGGVEDVK